MKDKKEQELDEGNMRALVTLLSDDDKEVLAHVESRIISLGESIIPFLESEWETNFNPNIQKKIEDLIHTLQYENVKRRLENWLDRVATNLLEGMWILSTFQYPDLEFEKLQADFEQLYYDVWLDLGITTDMSAFDQVKLLNLAIFGKLKFSANTKNFHSATNSMINVVIDTRKGNPISLCVVYMLIAQKLKMPVWGVNLPNLFILTYKTEESQFYINAFNKGLIFTKSDIDNYISHLNLSSNSIFYEPCSNIDIIRRVLRNMIISFEKIGDSDKVKELNILLNILDL